MGLEAKVNWLRYIYRRYIAKPVIEHGPVHVTPLHFVAVAGIPTEEHEADWRAGYQVGYAQGQLTGRQALADEIAQEFGVHGGQAPMSADDAQRIKARQVH